MNRWSHTFALLAGLLLVGCNSSPASYPDAANTAEAKKEVEVHDRSVDDAERAREKAR